MLRISRFDDLDERKLMDIYSESNFENTDYFWLKHTFVGMSSLWIWCAFCFFPRS